MESNLMKRRAAKHQCMELQTVKNRVSFRMRLESRIYPECASLHRASRVFFQAEHCQVWLQSWNIPVPKAQTHPPPCISCVSDSDAQVSSCSHAPGFFPSESSLTCGNLGDPREVVVRSGKDWMCEWCWWCAARLSRAAARAGTHLGL